MKNTKKHPDWQALPRALPQSIATWLGYEQSMTQKIKALDPDAFAFTLQDQTKAQPNAFEAQALPSNGTIIKRNIHMTQNHQRVLFGRTVGHTALFDNEKIFSTLGGRPIGEHLFNNDNIKRTHLYCTQLDDSHELYHAATKTCSENPDTLWARCARYQAWEYSLLIYEIFFPALFTWEVRHAIPA